MDKKDIRLLIKDNINNLNNRVFLDKLINEKLISFLQSYNNIGLYLSKDDEVNLDQTIKYFKDTKNIYVPKIIDDNIIFNKLDNNTIKNKYNIDECINDITINITDLDIIIVPLRAYDKHYNRVGRGKGYYDKILKLVKYKVGVGYSIQYINNINIEEHDIKLDYVITD